MDSESNIIGIIFIIIFSFFTVLLLYLIISDHLKERRKKDFKNRKLRNGKYIIHIEETYHKKVEVSAKNLEKAMLDVERRYYCQNIVLNNDDYEDTKFYVNYN